MRDSLVKSDYTLTFNQHLPLRPYTWQQRLDFTNSNIFAVYPKCIMKWHLKPSPNVKNTTRAPESSPIEHWS